MRTRLRSVAAALVGYAAWTARSRPAAPEPLALSRERVVSRGLWLDVQDIPLAYRAVGRTPLVGPYYILISYSRGYSVVDALAFTLAREDQFWTCEWHYAHSAS